jgi:hypothetical protein
MAWIFNVSSATWLQAFCPGVNIKFVGHLFEHVRASNISIKLPRILTSSLLQMPHSEHQTYIFVYNIAAACSSLWCWLNKRTHHRRMQHIKYICRISCTRAMIKLWHLLLACITIIVAIMSDAWVCFIGRSFRGGAPTAPINLSHNTTLFFLIFYALFPL